MRCLNKRTKSDSNPTNGVRETPCRSIRQRVLACLNRGIGSQAPWIQRHVASCPRCQKRFVGWSKVELALSVVKTEPHRLDLLSKANSHAVKMLTHALREAPQARKLEEAHPEPSFLERTAKYRFRLTNIAACIAVLVLTRSGLFNSLNRASAQGEEAMKQYYTAKVGEDIASEIFGS